MKGRPLIPVIEAIRNIIPADYPKKASIDSKMQDLADTVAHTAPELMGSRWQQFGHLLAAFQPEAYGKDAPAWAKTMADVYSGKKDYQDYLPKRPSATALPVSENPAPLPA